MKALLFVLQGAILLAACTYSDPTPEAFAARPMVGCNHINDLIMDANGDLWAATRSGIVKWDLIEGDCKKIVEGGDYEAAAVAQDKALWFVSSDRLIQIDGEQPQSFAESEGVVIPSGINGLGIDLDGGLWLGGTKVYRFDGESSKEHTLSPGGERNDVNEIVSGSDGAMWFATDNGVYRYDGGEWTHHSLADIRASGESSGSVNTLAVNPDGGVWAGTTWGISNLLEKSWHPYTFEEFGIDVDPLFGYFTTSASAVGPGDQVWVGTNSGLLYNDGSEWRRIRVADGRDIGAVSSLLLDPTGRLWVGTNGSGIFGFDGERWTHHIVEGELDDILPEEYAVYSGLIRTLGGHSGRAPSPLPRDVIDCRTFTVFWDYVPEILDGRVDRETWQDYLERNDRPYPLEEPACLPGAKETSDGSFSGRIFFSRPGFNPNMDQAVVYVGIAWGPLNREGDYVILEKSGGKWTVTERIMEFEA